MLLLVVLLQFKLIYGACFIVQKTINTNTLLLCVIYFCNKKYSLKPSSENSTFSHWQSQKWPIYYIQCYCVNRPCGHMGRVWDSLLLAKVSVRSLVWSPGCGTIVGWIFCPATGKVFSPEYAIYSKILIYWVNPRGEALNYRPSASPS